jgi:Kef-type K+ transport system membrane component KefB
MSLDLLFIELSLAIVTAGLLSLFAYRLRQPLIIAYVVTGLLVGSSVTGLSGTNDLFLAMSQIGIAFLLFLVGLNLNWRHFKSVGPTAFFVGLCQVIFTSLVGFFLLRWMQFDVQTSAFLGFSFALSSTIVIVKLLSDKEDLERLYGRVSVGILLFQDIVAMAALLFISAWKTDGAFGPVLAVTVLKGGVVLLVLWLIAKYLVPVLLREASRSPELLFLTAISWCFALASALHLLGFGIEIGALLAGITLAGSGFEREIGAKIRPVRDFFLVIYFIVLGTHLSVASVAAALIPALVMSGFILIGNPLIVMLVMRSFGHHPRTGFLVGTTMVPISEFAFIFLSAAAAMGLVSTSILPLTTLVALFTIAISSYLITNNERLYDIFARLFSWIEGKPQIEGDSLHAVDVLLFGYHRMGASILPAIQSLNVPYCVVDVDPYALETLARLEIPHAYGDAANGEFLTELSAAKAKCVISTIADATVSADIVTYIRSRDSKATVVVTVKTAEQATKLYELGATFVIVPSLLGGKFFADLLKKKKMRTSVWKTIAKEQKKALEILA